MPALNAQQASPNKTRLRSKLRNPRHARPRLFRSQGFNRRRPHLQTIILGTIKGSLTARGRVNQPVTILEMGRQPVTTTLGVGKQPTTIATATQRLCAATGMNGTTTIGGNNTT